MYLITNTSLRDSLYIEGIRIPSQKSVSFKTLKPLTLAMLKCRANVRFQIISEPEILNTTVTPTQPVSNNITESELTTDKRPKKRETSSKASVSDIAITQD